MTFVLSEDQQMLRDTAMTFAREELPVTHLRGLRDSGANGVDIDTRQKLAELGFFGVLIDEDHGGVDMGMVAIGQVMEAMGRTLAATPLLQTAVLASSILRMGGSAAVKSEWLPKIASGDVMMALAVDEGSHHAPLNISSDAKKVDDAYVLNGHKTYVSDGHHADVFIVVARTFGEPGQSHGLSLFLVPRNADGLSVQVLNTVDAHGAANLSFENVQLNPDAIIGAVDGGADILEAALDRGRIALAAEILGSSQAAFEMTLEYLQTRKQFGQLIGSFQALQHRAAKMFTALEMTRSCVSAALAAVDSNKNNIAELASLAKAQASELVHLVSNEAVQMHGGIGMTDAHDSGLYMKRARVQEALLGSASFHRDRYARMHGF